MSTLQLRHAVREKCGHTKQTGSQSDSNSSVLYRIFTVENMQIKRVIIEKQDNPLAETSAKCHWRPKNCLSVQPLFLVGRECWLHEHISYQTTSSITTAQRKKKPSQKTYSGVPDLYRLAITGKIPYNGCVPGGGNRGPGGSGKLRMELNPGEPTNRCLETEQP